MKTLKMKLKTLETELEMARLPATGGPGAIQMKEQELTKIRKKIQDLKAMIFRGESHHATALLQAVKDSGGQMSVILREVTKFLSALERATSAKRVKTILAKLAEQTDPVAFYRLVVKHITEMVAKDTSRMAYPMVKRVMENTDYHGFSVDIEHDKMTTEEFEEFLRVELPE